MIIWHGEWKDSFPPGIYRIRFEDGQFHVEHRRKKKDEWESDGLHKKPHDESPTMGEWNGIVNKYHELRLLP